MYPNHYKNQQGFSIVEFVVLVGIVSGVVYLGWPRYKEFRARAVQHEARINLNRIDHLQQKYFFNNDSFASSLNDLGFGAQLKDRYEYSIVNADIDGYIAQAEAMPGIIAACAGRDLWTINQDKTLRNAENGVALCHQNSESTPKAKNAKKAKKAKKAKAKK